MHIIDFMKYEICIWFTQITGYAGYGLYGYELLRINSHQFKSLSELKFQSKK